MVPAVSPATAAPRVPDRNSEPPSVPAEPGLLDAVLGAVEASGARSNSLLDRFLREPSPVKALAYWLGLTSSPLRPMPDREHGQLMRMLNRAIAELDALLTRQVNAILHHPSFQRLEASWRGLHYLVRQVPDGANIKLRVLSASWKELVRDVENALEFDQSQLFQKVYEEEFGHPGGEPYGVLLGDYEIHLGPSGDHPTDDVGALERIASVAAAAFAPFIAAAHPSLFDLDSFTELEKPLDVSKIFDRLECLKWRALRDKEDARFVGLTLPRVLMRLPYRDDSARIDGFRFREGVEAPDRRQYLWGNAAYAFGAILIRAFAQTGWLAAIRGVQQGSEQGGLVTELPVHSFSTDRSGIAPKCSTEVIITDAQEKELGDLGFIPLCHCHDTEYAAFYGNQSIQKPKEYDELPAMMNARLSAMLQYILCVSRFGHYIKVIIRDKVGRFTGPADCEDYLRRWLMNYTTATDKGGPELKSKYPLREAKVRVRERPDAPGSYRCVIHLRPHYQLDQMITAVKLTTELAHSGPDTTAA
jgi:type VI secretion system ImpC/EvpB family protein